MVDLQCDSVPRRIFDECPVLKYVLSGDAQKINSTLSELIRSQMHRDDYLQGFQKNVNLLLVNYY